MLVAAFPFALCGALPLQEKKEIRIVLMTKDGANLTGSATLPAQLPVKTKYGEVKVDVSTVGHISRAGAGWSVMAGGNILVGAIVLGPVEIQTDGGKLTVPEEDVVSIRMVPQAPPVVRPAPSPQTPISPGARPAGPAPAPASSVPRFRGYPVRSGFDPKKANIDYSDSAILLPGGKHLGLLDYDAEECVFLDLATGNSTRVKVESSPAHLCEKGGKVYVSNAKSNSLTVIDAKTLQAVGRIPVGASPTYLSAPAVGDVLYVVTNADFGHIQSLNTKTGKMNGPMALFANGKGIYWGISLAAPTPDNRLLVAMGTGGSPSHAPELYLIRGQSMVRQNIMYHMDHPGSLVVDFPGSRIYTGWYVYSLDMKARIAELPTSTLSVPHPTLDLVFGRKKKEGGYPRDPSGTVVVFDEVKLAKVCEIEIGEDILALVPSEKQLYVVGRSQVYPVEIAAHVPAAALKARYARIAVDLSRPVSAADIQKGERLVAEAQTALDQGKLDRARKLFEEALKADPLNGAKAGLGMVLVREKKYEEAAAFLQECVVYPFRAPASRLIVYNQLGIALAETGKVDEAVRTFQAGLQEDPKNFMILKNLGIAYGNSGKASLAFVMWTQCMAAHPGSKDVKELLDKVTAQLQGSTKEACPSCDGKGQHEVVVEDESGGRKKIIQKCRVCGGNKKVWRRPCVECQGSGRTGIDDYCDKCFGRGYRNEPLSASY